MSYPKSYHAAMYCLIHYYPVGDSDGQRLARSVIAGALRELRELRNGPSVYSERDSKRITSRERARRERDHMLFVNPGPFTKEKTS